MMLRFIFWLRNKCDTYLIVNAYRLHDRNCDASCVFCGNECSRCGAIQFIE